jgi:hypothetical protein
MNVKHDYVCLTCPLCRKQFELLVDPVEYPTRGVTFASFSDLATSSTTKSQKEPVSDEIRMYHGPCLICRKPIDVTYHETDVHKK